MDKNYRSRLQNRGGEIIDDCIDDKCCDEPCIENKDGDIVCLNCGTVHGRSIVGNERRAFTAQEVESRKITETRWREFGPRTTISNVKTDSKGQLMDAKGKTLFSRLSKIQKSLVNSIERNFWEAKPKLNLLCSKMNIPEYIRETAWKIYTVSAKKKLTMGRSIDGFICAALYAAIRIHEFPRLLEEVHEASMTPRHTIIRSLGLIVKEVLPELNLKYHPITAEQLIFRFGNELDLPMMTQKKALNLLDHATKNGLVRTGKDPKGFAASVLYIAAKKAGSHKTQAEVSNIAKITEVTLRSRVKDIKKRVA